MEKHNVQRWLIRAGSGRNGGVTGNFPEEVALTEK